jgi:hypothetical protein
MDSGKFTLTAEFVAATLRKFITGDIDVTVAASTVLVVPENMRGAIIDKYLQDEPPAVLFAVKRLLDIDGGVAPPQDRSASGSAFEPGLGSLRALDSPVPTRNCYLRIPIRQVGTSFGPVPQLPKDLSPWLLNALAIGGVSVYATDLRSIYRDAIELGMATAAKSQVYWGDLPEKPEDLADLVSSGLAGSDILALPLVKAVQKYVVDQDNAIYAAIWEKYRSTPASQPETKAILEASLGDAKSDNDSSTGAPRCSTLKVVGYVAKYKKRDAVKTIAIAVRAYRDFGTLQMNGDPAALSLWLDRSQALIDKFAVVVPNPELEYARADKAISALPAALQKEFQALLDQARIGGEVLTNHTILERMMTFLEVRAERLYLEKGPQFNRHLGGALLFPSGSSSGSSGGGVPTPVTTTKGSPTPLPPASGLRRAAAAAVTAKPSPVAGLDGVTQTTSDVCEYCNLPGHRVTVCPTVVFVPGSNGDIVKWTKCYSCGAFGHIQRICPKVKNGTPPIDGPSMGGGTR